MKILFLTNRIYYKWKNDNLKSEEANNFFCSSKNGKVKEVYDREHKMRRTSEFNKELSLFIG